ncbi:hypothetical protein [Bacillus sp. ISL-37]|uniref:hypothetical protein n=1 Tax=Bacillus sp. ISL-37 TaxID=2819123 RepID=UPI00336AC1DF
MNKGRNTLLKPSEVINTKRVITEKAIMYPSVSADAPNCLAIIPSLRKPENLRNKERIRAMIPAFFKFDILNPFKANNI